MKWGKEKFTAVECNMDETPELFKAQLFALSGVQPDRQKVMLKGQTLKDDSWGSLKLKDVSVIKASKNANIPWNMVIFLVNNFVFFSSKTNTRNQ